MRKVKPPFIPIVVSITLFVSLFFTEVESELLLLLSVYI